MPTKRVIDIDPDLLRRSAAAGLHAFEQAWTHIEKESTGHVPTILETLTAEAPWAWAIMSHAQPDGSIALPIHTTFEGIEEMYRMIRGHSDVISSEPLLDVRGEWYVMLECVAKNRVKTTGEETERQMVLLLPVTQGSGITGELCWVKMDRDHLGREGAVPEGLSPLQMRRDTLALHDRYLEALRANDSEAMLATFSPGIQSALRDYVLDTGTLVGLDDIEGHRDHYKAFFDAFEVKSADLLQRVVQDWYMFAETRLEVVARGGERRGETLAFHTGALLVSGKNGRFIVQIGHGTDLAPAAEA